MSIDDDVVADVQGADRPVVCPECGEQRVIGYMLRRVDMAVHLEGAEDMTVDYIGPTTGERELLEWDETLPLRCGECGAEFWEYEKG